MWLGWLATSGWLAPDSRPGERVTEGAVGAYIADLQPMPAPASLANRVRRLYTAMRLFEPDRDWGWLAQLKARLRRAEKATKSKPEALTSPGQLYKLGLDLSDPKMTEDHYNQAQRYKALQCLARPLEALRRQDGGGQDEG